MGGHLNRFYERSTSPGFCCGSNIHTSCSVRVKDFYSSLNQNSEHVIQDSSLRWNKTSTQQQDWRWSNRSQRVVSRWARPNKASRPSQLNWKLYAGATIKSDARPASVQLKVNYEGILFYEILMDCVARKRMQKTTSNYLKWFPRYCDLNFYMLSH